ncbi:MAG: hypothetical protein KC583_09685, partial [Myxococcales bacterium]|nr:hypothetical protein [Myxococcales bacterium]
IAPHAVHLDPDRWLDLLAGIVEQARTALGLADPRRLARQTHLDSLAARLAEPRVRRVPEPMLAVWAGGPPDPLDEGLQQLDGDLDRLGLDSGVLIVFDRRPDAAPIHARTALARATTPAGRDVTLFRA